MSLIDKTSPGTVEWPWGRGEEGSCLPLSRCQAEGILYGHSIQLRKWYSHLEKKLKPHYVLNFIVRLFSMEDSEFRTLHLRSKHTSSELSLVTFCMEIAPCIFFPSDNAVNGNGWLHPGISKPSGVDHLAYGADFTGYYLAYHSRTELMKDSNL